MNSINIPNYCLKALELLEVKGFSAYIVGGCVRDSFLNKAPYDWDICTSALPQDILLCFKDYTCIETGIKHGTVTVIIEKNQLEITTFRNDDNYQDHRHPETVSFSKDLHIDLSRRDFTVNAMAYNPKTGLIDIFSGLNDIKNKTLKTVGNPYNRFEEDSLRMLRCIRFSSTLGFEIEENTLNAIYDKLNQINFSSYERQLIEFKKLICGDFALVTLLKYSKIIFALIPQLEACMNCSQNNPHHIYNVYEHSVMCLNNVENDYILKFAALFHDIAKPLCKTTTEGVDHFLNHENESCIIANDILKKFKLDNKSIEKICCIIKYHDSLKVPSEKSVKRLLNKIGQDNFEYLLKLKLADIKAQSPIYYMEKEANLNQFKEIYHKIIAENQCFKLKDLSVNGSDLIKLGFKSGKELGNTLNTLLELVINSDLPNDKQLLLNYATKNMLNKIII